MSLNQPDNHQVEIEDEVETQGPSSNDDAARKVAKSATNVHLLQSQGFWQGEINLGLQFDDPDTENFDESGESIQEDHGQVQTKDSQQDYGGAIDLGESNEGIPAENEGAAAAKEDDSDVLAACNQGSIQLGPFEIQVLQWMKNIKHQSEHDKKAFEMLNDFLGREDTLQKCRTFFVDAFSSYLISTGHLDKHRETSMELLSQLKNEAMWSVNGKIGRIYGLQFLAMDQVQQKLQTDESYQVEVHNDDGTTQSFVVPVQNLTQEEVPIDFVLLDTPFNGKQEAEQQFQTALPEPNEVAQNVKVPPIPDLEIAAAVVQTPTVFAVDGIPQSSGKSRKRKSVDVLERAYTKMFRLQQSNTDGNTEYRKEKIEIAGKILFDEYFSLEEILKGNISGRGDGREKYDDNKIIEISKQIDWLLKNPEKRTLKEFTKHQSTTQSAGLSGTDYGIFKQSVLIDHAYQRRAEGKKKLSMKKTKKQPSYIK